MPAVLIPLTTELRDGTAPQLRTDAAGRLYLRSSTGTVKLQLEKSAEVATSPEWPAS